MIRSFKLWHSLLGTTLLLLAESIVVLIFGVLSVPVIMAIAAVGAAVNLYVATEIIEEIKEAKRMIELLSAVALEFIFFFAFQYNFLLMVEPSSFPTLPLDPTSLMLHSTMAFAFNPLYMPETGDGRLLLLINTLAGLGLVFFILQNIWQIRRTTPAPATPATPTRTRRTRKS